MASLGLKQVGTTPEGLGVVSGVYRLYDTHGIPLDVAFEALKAKDFIPDWIDFVSDALRAGMAPERILARMEPALCDVYGSEFRDAVMAKLAGVPWVCPK